MSRFSRLNRVSALSSSSELIFTSCTCWTRLSATSCWNTCSVWSTGLKRQKMDRWMDGCGIKKVKCCLYLGRPPLVGWQSMLELNYRKKKSHSLSWEGEMLSCCFWLPGAAHTHAHTDRRFCTAGSCQYAETRCERNVFVLLSRTKFERACGWVLPVFRAGEGGGGAGRGAASDWVRGNKKQAVSPTR